MCGVSDGFLVGASALSSGPWTVSRGGEGRGVLGTSSLWKGNRLKWAQRAGSPRRMRAVALHIFNVDSSLAALIACFNH